MAEYYHTDALGSVRAVTKVVNGQVQVVSRHDFMPFGEEVNPPNPNPDKRLFTGQERDFETGLDFFNARQLASEHGRFTTGDQLATIAVAFGDPQRYNPYAYAGNNPLRFVDPTGLMLEVPWMPIGMFTDSTTVTGTAGSMGWVDAWRLTTRFTGSFSGGTEDGAGSGGATAPTKPAPATDRGLLHNLICAGASHLFTAALLTNGTVGVGAGGNGGLLFGVGGAFGIGAQMVADPSLNLGVAINLSFGFLGFGGSVIGGGQLSLSNGKSVSALSGWSLSGDASFGNGAAADIAVSRSFTSPMTTFTGTVGTGIGTKAAVGSVSRTFVPSMLTINCGGR